MQTHQDCDFDLDRLQERAGQMVQDKASEITCGKPGEETLQSWDSANGVSVRQLPEDEQGILRISVGGGIQKVDVNYCVCRGDLAKCAHLLEKAAHALKDGPKSID